MAVHGAKRASGTRWLTTAALATTSLLLAGCTAATHVSGPPPSGAAPSSSTSASTTDISPVSIPIDGPPVIPDLVAPPLESLWYPFSNKQTHIRFHLPHTPTLNTYRGKVCGGYEVAWSYKDVYWPGPGHGQAGIWVTPSKALGTHGGWSRAFVISCYRSQLKSAAYGRVTVNDFRTGSVKGHPSMSFAISGRASKTGYWYYSRIVLVRGPSWDLQLQTSITVGKSGVTAAERRGTTRILTYLIQGLDFSRAG